jgi:hypothetical protein
LGTPVRVCSKRTQVKAGVAVIRFADEMFEALLEIGREPQPR